MATVNTYTIKVFDDEGTEVSTARCRIYDDDFLASRIGLFTRAEEVLRDLFYHRGQLDKYLWWYQEKPRRTE